MDDEWDPWLREQMKDPVFRAAFEKAEREISEDLDETDADA